MTQSTESGMSYTLAVYVTSWAHSPSATVVMETIEEALGFAVGELSDENYEQSLAFYRFWCETGGAYLETPSDKIFDAIWNRRGGRSSINPSCGKLFHASAHLILRFAKGAESDDILAPHSSGLQDRLCARILREFSTDNLMISRYGRDATNFYADVNLIAHWANLGHVGEAAIRNHILQSLLAHPKLYTHQVYALIILFKLAGGTFEAYVDPSVVDRCFEHLKAHSAAYSPAYDYCGGGEYGERRKAIQVGVPCVSNGSRSTKAKSRAPFKRWLLYGSAVGKVSLPHQCLRPGSPNPLVQTRETQPQLPSPHPSDFPTGISNLRSPHPLRWSRPPSYESQPQPPNLPSRPSSSLHPSVSPLSPTSRARILPMTSLPSTPRSLILLMKTFSSTLRQ